MDQRSSRNQTVLNRHSLARSPKVGKQFGSLHPRGCFPSDTMNFCDAFPEPAIQVLAPFASGKQQNAKSDFAKDKRVHANLTFVLL